MRAAYIGENGDIGSGHGALRLLRGQVASIDPTAWEAQTAVKFAREKTAWTPAAIVGLIGSAIYDFLLGLVEAIVCAARARK